MTRPAAGLDRRGRPRCHLRGDRRRDPGGLRPGRSGRRARRRRGDRGPRRRPTAGPARSVRRGGRCRADGRGRRRRPGGAGGRHPEAGATGTGWWPPSTVTASWPSRPPRPSPPPPSGPPMPVAGTPPTTPDCWRRPGLGGGTVPGDPRNLKLTRPEDLALAEALLAGVRRVSDAPACGSVRASTSMPFSDDPDRRLVLGGVDLSARACGAWPATGTPTWWPTPSPTPCWVPPGWATSAGTCPTPTRSGRAPTRSGLLERVVALAADAGWVPVNADCTVVAERPRLAPHVDRHGRSGCAPPSAPRSTSRPPGPRGSVRWVGPRASPAPPWCCSAPGTAWSRGRGRSGDEEDR